MTGPDRTASRGTGTAQGGAVEQRASAIVLAGGLGTRLRSIVADLPKPMAPVAGRPFLAYLLDRLVAAGFRSAVLAVGYRAENIRGHFGDAYGTLRLAYSVEDEPLGTGGAIRLALGQVAGDDVFVLNGDTYVELDYDAMVALHRRLRSRLTVAVHAVPDAARYGSLDFDDERICGFREKGRVGPGSINAGVYLLSRNLLADYAPGQAFSFESDVLVPRVSALRPVAFRASGRFIDIGVPDDYARAQSLLGGASVTGDGACE